MTRKISKIKELEEKINELENGWRRTQADFENYQKRIEDQKNEIILLNKADFMAKITPVLDNFRRAFKHANKDDEFAKGIKQIEKQLEDILNIEGLKRIDTSGEFNPSFHEAISYENDDKIANDHIIAEVESGWQFDGKVIKPAKVRVSRGNK